MFAMLGLGHLARMISTTDCLKWELGSGKIEMVSVKTINPNARDFILLSTGLTVCMIMYMPRDIQNTSLL
jgi:hypothetical protein